MLIETQLPMFHLKKCMQHGYMVITYESVVNHQRDIIRVLELLRLRGRRHADRGLRLPGHTRSQEGADGDHVGPLQALRQHHNHQVRLGGVPRAVNLL